MRTATQQTQRFSQVGTFSHTPHLIVFPALGAFVALNLFVGAIVDNFTRIKQETDGSASMTPEQKQWADSMRASL